MSDVIWKSIEQGVKALKRDLYGKRVIFDISHGWNNAAAENDAARQLECEINRNIGHSEASFCYALKKVCYEAKSKFNASVDYVDNVGMVKALDPNVTTPPQGTTKVVLVMIYGS